MQQTPAFSVKSRVFSHHSPLVFINEASPPAIACEWSCSGQQSETYEAISGSWSTEYLMRNFNELIQYSMRMPYILSLDWFFFSFFVLSSITEGFYVSLWWKVVACRHQILLILLPRAAAVVLFPTLTVACQDDLIVCFRKTHCRKLKKTKQEGLQFQHFALFADSLTINCSSLLCQHSLTHCSGKAFTHWEGERRRRRWKLFILGDRQPQRDASSVLGDRYFAAGCHVAKTKSCLGFCPLPLSFLSHSLLCRSPLFSFLCVLPFFFFLLQPLLAKVTVFHLLCIDPSFLMSCFPPSLFLSWVRLKPGGKAHWCFCRPPSPLFLFSQSQKDNSV